MRLFLGLVGLCSTDSFSFAAAAPLLSSVIYFGAEGKSEKRKGDRRRGGGSAKTKGNLSSCSTAVLLSLSLSSIERQRRERV